MRKQRLVIPSMIGLLLAWAVSTMALQSTPQGVNSGQHFLPPYENARDRFGFDSGELSGYDVSLLNAGWYSNWGAAATPAHPDQLVYAQLVRFAAGSDPHDPEQVTFSPNKATIAKIAAANPGSLWLLANEPDSVYQGAPIYPDVYAVAYHNLYEYIKGLDPSALIANGGIVQPTPCRLAYLDIVWDTYLATFGEPMPVDVWNIHSFILREVYNSWGASTPPGVDRSCAKDYTIEQADNMGIFLANLKAMRTWMKDRGYQDTPLVISEYGILWPQWYAPQFNAQRVSQFMTRTFDLFLNETDAEIGYPADDYRLVQTWAWYSLSDDGQYNGYLFRSGSKALSAMGQAFADYTAALSDTQQADLSARLVADWPSFSPSLTEPLTFTASLAGYIGNLGKAPASDVLARFEVIASAGGTAIMGQDAFYSVPARFEGATVLAPLTATLTLPGRHELRFSLDPEGRIDELREWNNVATVTLDLRPDLIPLTLTHHFSGSALQGRRLELTVTLGNQGGWGAPSGSAAVYLDGIDGRSQVISQTLPVPSLAAGESVSLTTSLPFSIGVYVLRVLADADNAVAESDEDNNLITATLDVWPDLLLVGLDDQSLSLRAGTSGLTADLSFTSVARNQGLWSSQAASATVYLETIPQGTLVLSESLPLPALNPDASVSLTASLSWPLLGRDLYRLRIVLDEEGILSEQDVSNNQGTWTIPIPVSANLVPTATTVLTNARGDVRLVFPMGAVDAPLEVVYTPFWPAEQVSATLRPSVIGFSLLAVGGEALKQPITVSWRYDEVSAIGMDVGRLRLFVQGQGDAWQDAACGPYQRLEGQVTVSICQTGRFVFGNRYDLYIPFVGWGSFSAGVRDAAFDEVNLPSRLAPH